MSGASTRSRWLSVPCGIRTWTQWSVSRTMSISVNPAARSVVEPTSTSSRALLSAQSRSPVVTGRLGSATDQLSALAARKETGPWMLLSRPTRSGGSSPAWGAGAGPSGPVDPAQALALATVYPITTTASQDGSLATRISLPLHPDDTGILLSSGPDDTARRENS